MDHQYPVVSVFINLLDTQVVCVLTTLNIYHSFGLVQLSLISKYIQADDVTIYAMFNQIYTLAAT